MLCHWKQFHDPIISFVDMGIDNVSFVVPEPGSMLLLTLGGLALLVYARRYR